MIDNSRQIQINPSLALESYRWEEEEGDERFRRVGVDIFELGMLALMNKKSLQLRQYGKKKKVTPLGDGALARLQLNPTAGSFFLSIDKRLGPQMVIACALTSVLFYFENIGRPMMTLSRLQLGENNHVFGRGTDVHSFIIFPENGSALGIRIGSFLNPVVSNQALALRGSCKAI